MKRNIRLNIIANIITVMLSALSTSAKVHVMLKSAHYSDTVITFLSEPVTLNIYPAVNTHSFVIYAEQGKPVSLLLAQESKPQGEPIVVRVEECRKSECHPVIGWIRV